jgi:hypothetical protein
MADLLGRHPISSCSATRHRRLLNEAEALLGELPSRLGERLPSGPSLAPRLAAAARLHLTSDRLTDLRLQILRIKAQEHLLRVAQCALLERRIAHALKGRPPICQCWVDWALWVRLNWLSRSGYPRRKAGTARQPPTSGRQVG